MEKDVKEKLEEQGYRFTGNNSAVKICYWTRQSLRNKDVCYKEKFYGIKSHMCCQMTPCMFCVNRCIYCWRDVSVFTGLKFNGVDEPKKIIENCIIKQRELLSGFKGNKEVDKKKFEEAQNPKFWAISLTGEPTLYPKLDELIKELNKRRDCSFLVTNGLFPENLEKLDTLPTQLYVSLDAPTKEIYDKIDRPTLKDSWERLNKTLELLPKLKTRKVIRITAIKGLNMCNEKDYVKLIKKTKPDFVEVKAYMWVGGSRKRLKESNMPLHSDIREFSEKIAKLLKWKIVDEKKESRVCLLMKEDKDRELEF